MVVAGHPVLRRMRGGNMAMQENDGSIIPVTVWYDYI
jgi:hypothetical protein